VSDAYVDKTSNLAKGEVVPIPRFVPVKVSAVPVVKALVLVAYATPFVVNPAPDVCIVPVSAGRVIVYVPVADGVIVVLPLEEPAKTKFPMFVP